MKVYVDELPKCCMDCSLKYYECESYWCAEYKGSDVLFANEVKEANLCPLQSLADYTKQVRKEVVEEIREKFKEIIFDSSTIDDILDQIQGE